MLSKCSKTSFGIRSSVWLLFSAFGGSLVFGCGSDDLDSNASGGSSSGAAATGGTKGGAGGATGGVSAGTGGTANTTAGSAGMSTGGAMGGSSNTGGSAVSGGSSNGGSSIPDKDCRLASDCGVANAVCDPADGKCKAFQCDATLECPADQICIAQTQNARGGVCHDFCVPFKDTCPNNGECISLDLDDTEGFCLPRGSVGRGESCEQASISSSCTAGLICASLNEESECAQACSFFGTGPACPSDQRCLFFGLCSAPEGDAAGLNESCEANARPGDFCADDKTKLAGVCLPLAKDDAPTCLQLCSMAQAKCGGPSFQCQQFTAENLALGVCVDTGECGDGGQEYDTCQACIEAETEGEGCCADLTAECTDDPECSGFGACWNDCGENATEACFDSCVTDFPNGVELFLAWLECSSGSPSGFVGACGVVCGQ